eukprot:CAMPEP_0170344810 /NCGR_PEP_ID=MMETSP0116_2-20130129/73615_1 /TAXON_ID=400756 /ORGANISM="Durinskia baltica, Strain CSIRO CS-38" /LENGTH=33 /DNA_ID= /DNA_START= /DNA_END= /DNA_ORIENTATION=
MAAPSLAAQNALNCTAATKPQILRTRHRAGAHA